MAKYVANLASALIIRLHILYDMILGDSTWSDMRDPSIFITQCQLIAEHEIDLFFHSQLLNCFASEHEGEMHEHVIELFIAEGDTDGRGTEPRRYLLDLISRKVKVECGIFTIDSSPMEAAEDYAEQGRDALIPVKFTIVLAKMFINNHPCYVSANRR